MQRLVLWLLALVIWGANGPLMAQKSTSDAYLKKIIGDLSGETEMEGLGTLKARSTKWERERTRKYLLGRIEALGLTGHRQKYTQPNIHPVIDLILAPFRGANIYTTLPATKATNKYLVIGAHFDTERGCPGAIDNASGIAIILQVIRQLQQVPNRNHHVIAVFFDQEEEHLNGSSAFVQFLLTKDYDIHSIHTLDGLGWDRNYDQAIELESPAPSLDARYRAEAEALEIPIFTTKVIGSDHESFRDLGWKVTGITDELVGGDYTPYKDTPNDTFSTVNFNHLQSTASLIFNVFKTICKGN